jgi:hypothetical protein
VNDTLSYTCIKMENLSDEAWHNIQALQLLENTSGVQPRLRTNVKAVWTSELVCFRFECEDDHIVASYKLRDEPLYEEDVVEIFIDEVGDGHHYQEYEVSPHNILFDALIENDLAGSIQINLKWNAAGIQTAVSQVSKNSYVYSINIPHSVFSTAPHCGLEWRVNFYRIDDDLQGNRHYSAWSPTGILNFHMPSHFGRFVFA